MTSLFGRLYRDAPVPEPELPPRPQQPPRLPRLPGAWRCEGALNPDYDPCGTGPLKSGEK